MNKWLVSTQLMKLAYANANRSLNPVTLSELESDAEGVSSIQRRRLVEMTPDGRIYPDKATLTAGRPDPMRRIS